MGSKSSSSGSLLPSHMLQQQSAGQLQKLALIGFISLLLTVNLLYQVKTHARMQQLSAGSGTTGVCLAFLSWETRQLAVSSHHATLGLACGICAGCVTTWLARVLCCQPVLVLFLLALFAAAGCHQQGQFPGSTSKQLAAGAGSLDTQQDAASEAAERKAVDYLVNNVLTSRPQRHVVENAILPKLKATNKTVAEYRTKVSNYLSSSEFKQRWDALKAQVGAAVSLVTQYAPECRVLMGAQQAQAGGADVPGLGRTTRLPSKQQQDQQHASG